MNGGGGAGDKRTEPQQLFRLRVVLDASSRVAFAPSLKQLSDMINACSKAIINMLQVHPTASQCASWPTHIWLGVHFGGLWQCCALE